MTFWRSLASASVCTSSLAIVLDCDVILNLWMLTLRSPAFGGTKKWWTWGESDPRLIHAMDPYYHYTTGPHKI